MSDEHPSLFTIGATSDINESAHHQPLVSCKFNGVEFPALIDTGSMKSILGKRAFQKISQSCAERNQALPVVRSATNDCISVTGDPLKFSGVTCLKISFPGNSFQYLGNFMICDNVLQSLQCILGWDFLASNGLQLSLAEGSYFLVGPHGGTSLTPLSSCPGKHPSNLSAAISPPLGGPSFTQSSDRGPVFVTLANNVILPPRTESIINARIPASCSDQLGMVCNLDESSELVYATAYSLSQATNRNVPIRILNSSESSTELHQGQKIAKFWPVVESVSVSQCASSDNDICASVTDNTQISPDTLAELHAAISPNLDSQEKAQLLQTLLSFSDVFSNSLGHTTVTAHKVDTGDAHPIRQYPRRLPYHYRDEVDKQVQEMLSQGVVEPSTSPWASPIVLVKKKDGSYRFCVDYRKLNLVTKQDAHPLPRVDDLLDSLNGYKMFSTLDLRSGYWQLSMHPDDREKTAFITHNGLYEFLRMPYGLSTAPATFSRAIDIVLSGLTYEMCLCYFDDVIIFSKNMEDHCHRLQSVLQRFRYHNLRVKASKCSFGADRVTYLGHVVSSQGVHTDPSKTKRVEELSAPSNVDSLRSFFGSCRVLPEIYPPFCNGCFTFDRFAQKEYHLFMD